jgi:Phosphoinositide 3-kinase family, accessory domain (PIK domain)
MSVNWIEKKESKQAIILMKQWAKIELEQALALLSGIFSLNNVYS